MKGILLVGLALLGVSLAVPAAAAGADDQVVLRGSLEVKTSDEGTTMLVHLHTVVTKLADANKTHGPGS